MIFIDTKYHTVNVELFLSRLHVHFTYRVKKPLSSSVSFLVIGTSTTLTTTVEYCFETVSGSTVFYFLFYGLTPEVPRTL